MKNSYLFRTVASSKTGLPLLLLFLPVSAFSQQFVPNDAKGSESSSGSTTSTSSAQAPVTSSNELILKELDAMRVRIQELESQLKAQSASHPDGENGSSTPAAAAVSNNAFATTTASAEPAARVMQEQTSAQNGPQPASQEKSQPFAWADWSWLNGNARTKTPAFDSKFFTPEIRADVDYIYDFAHPADNTIGGSSEVFRANEFQVTQLGVGGDFHYDNVIVRLMTQLGMYSQTTPRNDASPSRGQWNLADAYRYVSEAYGGYHFNAMHGINVEAGIFMSYVGLFSYYNFDNWAYQPSYVSSNTPWFFNGMRVQFFPTDKLKIEPWLINGWQSYGRFNHRPGIGGQILWRPRPWVSILGNQYALGADALGVPGRIRYHTDDSIQVKYYDRPENWISKAAFTVTADAGCEHGGGVSCAGNSAKGPKQSFLGYMVYNRLWLHHDLFGFTLGGGQINNPGRYLVLLPPINGATASSGTPYFTENPGDQYKAWDASATFDYMPSQYITFRWEYNHRVASVPYFSGSGGVTPPGGNQGSPGSFVPGFAPDLRTNENRLNMALLVKF